jgi:hypothetical protein
MNVINSCARKVPFRHQKPRGFRSPQVPPPSSSYFLPPDKHPPYPSSFLPPVTPATFPSPLVSRCAGYPNSSASLRRSRSFRWPTLPPSPRALRNSAAATPSALPSGYLQAVFHGAAAWVSRGSCSMLVFAMTSTTARTMRAARREARGAGSLVGATYRVCEKKG